MKNTRLNLLYLWSISLVCLPLQAHANAIIPYMVVPWGQVLLLPVVILIEALILRRLLREKFRTSLYLSFIANLASTILGAVLFVITMSVVGNFLFEWSFTGNSFLETTRNNVVALLFAIFLWTISWLSEKAVILRMGKTNSITNISFSCAVANLVSYALLLTLAIWFGKSSTSVEAHVDLKRNSGNIETFLKPDKNFPYIGFWKTDCIDDFGLAIEATSDGKYTVAFCGPGGCDRIDKLPHTTLPGDSNYRIINENTIAQRGYSGPDSIYHRCGSDK